MTGEAPLLDGDELRETIREVISSKQALDSYVILIGVRATAPGRPEVLRYQSTDRDAGDAMRPWVDLARSELRGVTGGERADHPAGSDDQSALYFSHIVTTVADETLTVWCVGRRQSTSGLGPLILRLLWQTVVARARAAVAGSPSLRSAAELFAAGDFGSAAERIAHYLRADAAMIWQFDVDRNELTTLACAGVERPKVFTVPLRARQQDGTRVGILSELTPAMDRVMYDVLDRSAWDPPSSTDWRPYDNALFRSEGWQSVLGFPVVSQGRLVGAISVYSRGSLSQSRCSPDVLRGIAFIAAGHIHRLVNRALYERLERQFDDEMARTNVSIMALGHVHDVVGYVLSLQEHMDDLRLEVDAANLRNARALIGTINADVSHLAGAIDRMREITDDVRQGQRDYCSPAATVLDLKDFLTKTAGRLSGNKVRRVLLSSSVDEGVVVKIEPLKFERIVLNLVSNAAQWGARQISLILSRREDQFILAVEDDGIGIAAEAAEHVFDRLYSTRKGGSGLGLYLVRFFAEEAQGSVTVSSDPRGRSTRFEVRLPVAEAGTT